MKEYDIVLLTEDRYENAELTNAYISNVVKEDNIVKVALENIGLKVKIVSWSNPNFDWESTKIALFRTIWDYFDRFDEFRVWLESVKTKTRLINTYETINWNMDKHYLIDLLDSGINIPKSIFFHKGEVINFNKIFSKSEFSEIVVKPTISGAARDTFRLDKSNYTEKESHINSLLKNKDFIIQPFEKNIIEFGEISIMIINGIYTHAVIKRAKKGDYRVQDDYGGSVELYKPKQSEINFAIKAYNYCSPKPLYARVDIIYDNNNNLAITELELIEPEFWYRFNANAAEIIATEIKKIL